MYIQRLNYQVFPMKTLEAWIWTQCVEKEREGWVTVHNKGATELYFTICVIWGYHVQNSTTRTL